MTISPEAEQSPADSADLQARVNAVVHEAGQQLTIIMAEAQFLYKAQQRGHADEVQAGLDRIMLATMSVAQRLKTLYQVGLVSDEVLTRQPAPDQVSSL